jgi:hypothetical protein
MNNYGLNTKQAVETRLTHLVLRIVVELPNGSTDGRFWSGLRGNQ